MDNKLIQHIIDDIRSFKKKVVLVENPDRFLSRKDVCNILSQNNIFVIISNKLEQRIRFELRDKYDGSKILLFLSDDNQDYLEDILKESIQIEFHLSNYIKGFHTSSLLECELDLLNSLYLKDQIVTLSKKETIKLIDEIKQTNNQAEFNVEQFKFKCEELLSKQKTDWFKIINLFSNAIKQTIDTIVFQDVIDYINIKNESFQSEIKNASKYASSSSAIKKPNVVSKILDNLNHNHNDEKIALIVIDGMAFWQYLMLKNHLDESLIVKDNFTYSWIPSITELSRQALFRGAPPKKNYIQNPQNEERLWNKYWLDKGLKNFELRYNHGKVDLSSLERITKFAIVYTALDEKMHVSDDYIVLKYLTDKWLNESKIASYIKKLTNQKFKVYITTDHGNLPAKGWRSLTEKEKVGTKQSGSKSTRHIEYTDQSFSDDFIESNKDIEDNLMRDENAIYFINNLSFSRKDQIVTHGGSHILEVIIPFIKISNE